MGPAAAPAKGALCPELWTHSPVHWAEGQLARGFELTFSSSTFSRATGDSALPLSLLVTTADSGLTLHH